MESRAQTIFALSSGQLPSAIAIIRLSGPQAGIALRSLCRRALTPRVASVLTLRDAGGESLDEAVALWFPAPHSATGEDVVELHVHGGRAVIAAVFDALAKIPGLRPAEPGEFTRRAFENGKLDLTEAEGLDDLIHADTDRQRRQALRQMKGLLGDKAESWRKAIIEAAALIEAGIDFSDEDDVPDGLIAPALRKIGALKDEIEEVLAASAQSERLRDGLVVAIAGPPNAGKSTLLNRLARREAAIVSPHAGTTRDVIEVHLDLDGYPVTLLDTAGVRDTNDPVEQEGVRRARDRAASADLVLWLIDANDADANGLDGIKNRDAGAAPNTDHAPVWIVRNKIDLVAVANSAVNPAKNLAANPRRCRETAMFAISATTGEGVAPLIEALVGFARECLGSGDSALISRTRHRVLLVETRDSLLRALDASGQGEELVAEELRTAIHSLARLTGRVDVDDILDAIFRDFCVGK